MASTAAAAGGIDGFGKFLDRPQRLTKPLAGGRHDVGDPLSLQFRCGFGARPNIAEGVAMQDCFANQRRHRCR
jgi:hypothetical protein